MGALKQKVRERLQGYEQRMQQRQDARRWFNLRTRLYEKRKAGKFNLLEEAREQLRRMSIEWIEEYAGFGIVVLNTSVKVTLAYGPNGKLSPYKKRRILSKVHDQVDTLFSSTSGGSP